MRNWLLDDKHDQRVEQLTLNIVHEDIAILENLNPVRTPETNNKEILVPGDAAVLRYRQHLKEWQARGWRIDMHVAAETGRATWLLPFPRRRVASPATGCSIRYR